MNQLILPKWLTRLYLETRCLRQVLVDSFWCDHGLIESRIMVVGQQRYWITWLLIRLKNQRLLLGHRAKIWSFLLHSFLDDNVAAFDLNICEFCQIFWLPQVTELLHIIQCFLSLCYCVLVFWKDDYIIFGLWPLFLFSFCVLLLSWPVDRVMLVGRTHGFWNYLVHGVFWIFCHSFKG